MCNLKLQVFKWVRSSHFSHALSTVENRKCPNIYILPLCTNTALLETCRSRIQFPKFHSISLYARKCVSELIRDDVPTLKTKLEGYTCCLQPTIPNTNEKCNCRKTKSHPHASFLNESTQRCFALIIAIRATSESETMRQCLPSVALRIWVIKLFLQGG